MAGIARRAATLQGKLSMEMERSDPSLSPVLAPNLVAREDKHDLSPSQRSNPLNLSFSDFSMAAGMDAEMAFGSFSAASSAGGLGTPVSGSLYTSQSLPAQFHSFVSGRSCQLHNDYKNMSRQHAAASERLIGHTASEHANYQQAAYGGAKMLRKSQTVHERKSASMAMQDDSGHSSPIAIPASGHGSHHLSLDQNRMAGADASPMSGSTSGEFSAYAGDGGDGMMDRSMSSMLPAADADQRATNEQFARKFQEWHDVVFCGSW